jgi:hypothetical protein
MKLPDYIVEEIAARRVVFFLGAGACSGSKSADGKRMPPQWDELLDGLRRRTKKRTVKDVAKELMNQQDLLGAAEVLVDALSVPDFHSYLTDVIQRPDYQDNELIRAIHDLDPKIVVSTNYDLIYEGVCADEIRKGLMKTKTYLDNDIVDSIRSGVRLYIYAHGCIKSPSDIVLTTSQYYTSRRKSPGFYAVLESLFMTSTVVFVGYSLRDPDIQLLFESNGLKVRSSRKHLLITQKGNHTAVIRAMEAKYDLKVIEYAKGKHEQVHQYFSSILPDVELKREVGV